MMTVYEVVTRYCESNALPLPSGKDLSTIGKEMSGLFRKQSLNSKPGPIPETGLILQEEQGKRMVVLGYPLLFAATMFSTTETFYAEKKKRQESALLTSPVTPTEAHISPPEPKKRSRIPAKPLPAYISPRR